MLYCYEGDTGEIPAVDASQWTTIQGVSVEDVQEISQAFQAIRTVGNGDGKATIFLLGGWFDRVETLFTRHRKKRKKFR